MQLISCKGSILISVSATFQAQIPEMIVYSSETVLAQHMDIMRWIPLVGEECLRLNPGMKCADPPYEFCEFLDGEYQIDDRLRRKSHRFILKRKERCRARCARTTTVVPRCACDSLLPSGQSRL